MDRFDFVNLTMTFCAAPGCFRSAVAFEAFGRFQAAIDTMPRHVITSVGGTTSWIGMAFQRGFQFHPDSMAIAAIAGPMAHFTHPLGRPGDMAVLFTEQTGVAESGIGKRCITAIIAIQAPAQVFTFIRMAQGQFGAAWPSGRYGSHPYGRCKDQKPKKSQRFHATPLKLNHNGYQPTHVAVQIGILAVGHRQLGL